MTCGTVFADKDANGDYAMCRLIFLAVYAIFVEWAFCHLLLKKFFELLWWFKITSLEKLYMVLLRLDLTEY